MSWDLAPSGARLALHTLVSMYVVPERAHKARFGALQGCNVAAEKALKGPRFKGAQKEKKSVPLITGIFYKQKTVRN